jgi:hypothetical protein
MSELRTPYQDLLLERLREAGARGLAGCELVAAGGRRWPTHVDALEAEGYELARHASRRRPSETWRVVLVREPQPALEPPAPPAQGRLLDPPALPALFEGVAA